MKVKDLIALLQTADPEQLVFTEAEGDYCPLREDELTVGLVHLVRWPGDELDDEYERWFVRGGDRFGQGRVVRTERVLMVGKVFDERLVRERGTNR